MKDDAIKKLVYGFWERDLGDVKSRQKGLEFLNTDFVNDIVGVKRAGKTYSMFYVTKALEENLGRKQFVYLNCEHRSVCPLKLDDLNYLVRFIHQHDLLKKKVFLMLDEVQTVDGWEVFVKSIYDEFKGKIKVLVSGSVKSLLSEDYGKLLSGRHKTITMFPLSFEEYLHFEGIERKRITEAREAKLKKAVEDFIRFGGFPEYVITRDKDYLEQAFDDIIERDIKSRTEIRKKHVIDELASLLLERTTSRISFTKIRNILRNKGYRVSTDLVIRYISTFEKVFLFFLLPVYSPKYSQVIKNPKKVYVIDNGFLSIFPLKASENFGNLVENAVFLELLERGLRIGKELFYYSSGALEVDFIIKQGPKIKQLIQACYDINGYDTKERETRALLKASKELKCNNLLVLTWDYEGEEKTSGRKIKFVPLWKWLLNTKPEKENTSKTTKKQ